MDQIMRDINGLAPVVREKFLQLQAAAREKGIEFMITCTLRTEAEQLALFAQGRKTVGEVNRLRRDAGLSPITEAENKIVTRVLTSIHQFGCAFDVALLRRGTQTPTWDRKADFNKNGIPDYFELGKLGEALGLRWGGAFRFGDFCHFEYTNGLTLAELKEGKRPAA
ncbi:MAG: M15 family metallopeptidase [Nitrospiraceae bacterium]|nr:M15 family metallopeptidase [Nitrospiraceae bacterium]